MIKCCQNCHWFRKDGSVCESGEIIVNTDEMIEAIEDDGGTCYDEFAHLARVTIKDPQNFCCNAWR